MNKLATALRLRHKPFFMILLVATFFVAAAFGITQISQAQKRKLQKAKDDKANVEAAQACVNCPDEPQSLKDFRESVGGFVRPMIVELKDAPGVQVKLAAEKKGRTMSVAQIGNYGLQLRAKQIQFADSLAARGVHALVRESDVEQADGSVRHIEYRFHYLLNGFVAYVASQDIELLSKQPEVKSLRPLNSPHFMLDKAIDYSLGTIPDLEMRRTAVYGATREFTPVGSLNHPETPSETRTDGVEGQGLNIAVIDSGIDWRHPMFGGTGLTTPTPRISGNAPSASDNTKVIYYYALSSPGEPTDDFGHGTLVSSCAAGYKVDGNTPANAGYGTGRDNTGVGPVPNGATLHGTAPQAHLMEYKVCGPAPQCAGDSELAMEDAVSPVTLVGTGTSPTPTMVAKPVADIINLSLGDTAGDPTSASAMAANDATLAGAIVVAAAGNSGPGPSTTGAPSVGTLALSVAASLDPGSLGVSELLAPNQIPGEIGATTGGPAPVTGAASNALTLLPNGQRGLKIFPVAGGGSLPGDSLSAHYVYVDETSSAPTTAVTNRIALVKGTGAFADIANEVAPLNPAAILIITATESATALVVANGIPTYTIFPDNANYLLDNIDGTHNHTNTPSNTISNKPYRLLGSAPPELFQPGITEFSSRGPEGNANARFRAVKPDVAAPGAGIYGAATPTGLQEAATGLSNPKGYVQASGTSFSSPITAGAMALIRQHVRLDLGFDTTTLNDAHYRSKRFEASTISRALLMNNAVNLPDGFGVPMADNSPNLPSINDMGAGHINIAGAIAAHAIMVAPTFLQTDEFTAPTSDPPPASDFDSAGNLKVFQPSVSFASVPVVGVNNIIVKTREVNIRDITNGQGAGVYNLASVNSRNTDNPGVNISFLAADGTTPTTSVSVPANGQGKFFVRIAVNGNIINSDPTELQWYVTATHATSSQRMRMPFYYRAVKPVVDLLAGPTQAAPTNTEQPPAGGCPVDTNGNYNVNFTYTAPSGGSLPVGFRIQEATRSTEVFFDNADETLTAGANSKWEDTATPPQWTSNVNPDTGSMAYYVPDTAMQDEPLAMINSVALPAGGATLSFVTSQDLEQDFDFASVEISKDGGSTYTEVAKYTGTFSGTRSIDISPFAGQSVKLRFRLASDTFNIGAPVGWYVEDIRLSSDDFHTIAEVGPTVTTLPITGRSDASYIYRVAGLFNSPSGTVVGPYSNTQCVTVQGSGNPVALPPNVGDVIITELRLRGATGATDEFIELYNATDNPIRVATGDASGGWTLAASSVDGLSNIILVTIPNGTTIPSHGHYLVTNSGYSLGAYPAGNSVTAIGDQTYSGDIPDNTGVALFSTTIPSNFTATTRLDAVGFASVTNSLYREGTGVPAVGTSNGQYSFVRKTAPSASGYAGVGNFPQDTNNNANDFVFVATTNSTFGGTIAAVLGSPGPDNLFSPIVRDYAHISGSYLDPTTCISCTPNRDRNGTPVTNGPAGTLIIRRSYTNNTGAPITRLRFRVVDITTLNTPGGGAGSGQADLRPITSADSMVTVFGVPTLVRGTTLEQPPDQTANGGGMNSTLTTNSIALAQPLPVGMSVPVQFVMGVQQSGRFRFLIVLESLP